MIAPTLLLIAFPAQDSHPLSQDPGQSTRTRERIHDFNPRRLEATSRSRRRTTLGRMTRVEIQPSRWPPAHRNLIFSPMKIEQPPHRHFGRAPPLFRPAASVPASWLPCLVAALFVLMSPAACSPTGEDASSPSRPIEIVSWATPRSPSDLLSRALAAAPPPHFDVQRVNVMTPQGGARAAGMQYMQGRAAGPPRARRDHG